MKNLIDSAIGLTFAKNNRHDFFSALAQVLMSKYSDNIRWIRCTGWKENNIFGIAIPTLRKGKEERETLRKGKEERETLIFYKSSFSFFFGYTNDSKRVKGKIRKLFDYLNRQFSSNTICQHLMLDWFWNLMLLSKGKITDLKQRLTECEENVIHEIVENMITNKLHKNGYSITEKQLLNSIEELCSKYYEYFGKKKDFKVLLKKYLCGDWKEANKSSNNKRPGKLYYVRSIESVVKRNANVMKDLLKLEDQSDKKELLHLLYENNVFLDIRSRFYDLFCIYLENQTHPYFFIYNPFNRHFYYRGIVADLDHIDMSHMLKDIAGISTQITSELGELKKKIGIDSKNIDYLNLFIQRVGQPFDEDLIRYLFVGRKPLWIENFYDEFNVPPISDKRRYIEQEILRIFGNKKTCSFFFAPLICDGQYRGNLYVRVDDNKEVFSKLKSVMPILSNYCSQKIEDYYYQQFMKETLENDTPTFELILDNLPYLLNVEAAGYIPIEKRAGMNGDHEPFRCINYTRVAKRRCDIWGFSGSSAYKNLNLAKLKCIGKETDGRCLWNELYSESTKIGEKTKLVFFDISIYDLTHEIERHCVSKKKRQIDIRQSYDWVYSVDESQKMLAKNADTSRHKVIFSWKLLNSRGDHDYLIWLAIDLSPWVFNKVKASIIVKLDTIAEIKKVLEERIEFFRAFEHDTSRFVDYFRYINPGLKAIIKQRSKVTSVILGAPIKKEDPKPMEQLKEDIEYLFAAMDKQGKKRIKLVTEIKIGIDNQFYWYFIETILTNLMSNTIKNARKSGSEMITIALYENNNLLCLDYHQTGKFSFEVAAADIHKWLNGNYERDERELGLGHTIMQRVTDTLKGTLCVKWKSQGNGYEVTRHAIRKPYKCKTNETELSYLFKLEKGL